MLGAVLGVCALAPASIARIAGLLLGKCTPWVGAMGVWRMA